MKIIHPQNFYLASIFLIKTYKKGTQKLKPIFNPHMHKLGHRGPTLYIFGD